MTVAAYFRFLSNGDWIPSIHLRMPHRDALLSIFNCNRQTRRN